MGKFLRRLTLRKLDQKIYLLAPRLVRIKDKRLGIPFFVVGTLCMFTTVIISLVPSPKMPVTVYKQLPITGTGKFGLKSPSGYIPWDDEACEGGALSGQRCLTLTSEELVYPADMDDSMFTVFREIKQRQIINDREPYTRLQDGNLQVDLSRRWIDDPNYAATNFTVAGLRELEIVVTINGLSAMGAPFTGELFRELGLANNMGHYLPKDPKDDGGRLSPRYKYTKLFDYTDTVMSFTVQEVMDLAAAADLWRDIYAVSDRCKPDPAPVFSEEFATDCLDKEIKSRSEELLEKCSLKGCVMSFGVVVGQCSILHSSPYGKGDVLVDDFCENLQAKSAIESQAQARTDHIMMTPRVSVTSERCVDHLVYNNEIADPRLAPKHLARKVIKSCGMMLEAEVSGFQMSMTVDRVAVLIVIILAQWYAGITIVDWIALNLLKTKSHYKEAKFSMSKDFGDVRARLDDMNDGAVQARRAKKMRNAAGSSILRLPGQREVQNPLKP